MLNITEMESRHVRDRLNLRVAGNIEIRVDHSEVGVRSGNGGDIVENDSGATGTELPAAFKPAPPLGAKSAPTASSGQTRTLFERLGGKEAINAVVDDFAGNVLADNRINKKFAKTDATRLLVNLKDFVCAATGGPCRYTGLDMKTSHKNMGTTAGEFNALVEDLERKEIEQA